MSTEGITLEEFARFLRATKDGQESHEDVNGFFKIGNCYLIQTVTTYHVGRLIGITPQELLLEKVTWVPDTGRFHDSLLSGEFEECEPFTENVVVNRGAIIVATEWKHDLPREQK